MDDFRNYLTALQAALTALDLQSVEKSLRLVAEARQRRCQIFLCGNGGSASTASHMANDLGKGASFGGKSSDRFRVTSLTDNVPWITSLANDVNFEAIYSEQLRNLGKSGDLLIAISGSGNSRNVLNAVTTARELGMATIGWAGFGGGKLANEVDVAVVVESYHMGRVEDVHTVVMHLICYFFMEETQPA